MKKEAPAPGHSINDQGKKGWNHVEDQWIPDYSYLRLSQAYNNTFQPSYPYLDFFCKNDGLVESGNIISQRLWKYPLSYMFLLTTTSTSSRGDLWKKDLHLLAGRFSSLLIPLMLALSAAALALASLSFLCQFMYSCHLKVCNSQENKIDVSFMEWQK